MEIVSQRLQDKWKKHTTSETAQENSIAKVFFGVGWGWGSVVGAEKAELPTFCILHSTMGFFFFFFFFSPSFFFFFSSQVKQWEWRRNKEICNWLWSINCKHHCTRTSPTMVLNSKLKGTDSEKMVSEWLTLVRLDATTVNIKFFWQWVLQGKPGYFALCTIFLQFRLEFVYLVL